MYMFPELSIASREKEIWPFFQCISVVGTLEGSGKICTHNYFSIPKKRRKKSGGGGGGGRGHHNAMFPRYGLIGKFLRKGGGGGGNWEKFLRKGVDIMWKSL